MENCVQAIARDCLATSIDRLEAAGLQVVFHVHDEVVIDAQPWDTDDTMLARVCEIMGEPIPGRRICRSRPPAGWGNTLPRTKGVTTVNTTHKLAITEIVEAMRKTGSGGRGTRRWRT